MIGQPFLKPFEKIGNKKISMGGGKEFVSTKSLPASLYGRSVGNADVITKFSLTDRFPISMAIEAPLLKYN